MLSLTKIKQMTDTPSFSKGLSIYSQNQITRMESKYVNENDDVTASVREGKSTEYQVNFQLHTQTDEVESISCTCPGFYARRGICEHCVAVLMHYMYLQATDPRIATHSSPLSQPSRKQQRQKQQKQKKVVRHTTPELSQLFQKQAVAKSLPLLQADAYGQVRLEPSFFIEDSVFYVEFKIGISKMYVLKDVFTFVKALDQQEDYQYGKNLHFIHTMEAFREDSKPLVTFLQRWAEENRDRHRQNTYYGYYSGATEKVRYMDLQGSVMTDFLLLMEGKTIDGNIPRDRATQWTPLREKPSRTLTITGTDQGIQLETTVFPVTGFTSQFILTFQNGKIYMESLKDLPASVREFISLIESSSTADSFIETKDVPAFCQDFLPSLKEYYQCKTENFLPEAYGMAEPEFHIYLDMPQENMITCKPMVHYGKQKFSLYTTKEIAMRNLAAEMAVRQLILNYTNTYDPALQCACVIDDEELAFDLLFQGIPALQAVGQVYISDALKRMEVQSAPKVTVGVSLDGELLNLTMTAGDMSREELLDVLSRYNRKKKYYRLKDGTFVNAQDSGLDTILELKDGLLLTDKQMKQDQVQVQKFRALYLDAQLKENPVVSAVKNRSFRSLVRNMKTIEDNDFEIPQSLDNVLREYQKKGFLWIKTLRHNGFGGILADDMGLGKTLQVIAFLLSEFQENHPCDGSKTPEQTAAMKAAKATSDSNRKASAKASRKAGSKANRNALIVAPASLVYNWNSEIQRFAPELTPCMVTGTAAERQDILKNAGEDDILLTSYDLLKRDIAEYEKYHFRCQVIDEAQYIKNSNTQAAKAVKEVVADFRMALTGTPVENRLSELWSIFDYLMPGFLYPYKKFREEIEIPVVQNSDEDATRRLQKLIRPFVLRRLKKDVLTDLPDKLEENMFAKLTGEQQKLYDAHVKRMMLLLNKQTEEEFKSSKITILAELTRLRQICCDPSLVFEDYKGESAKADMCMNLITGAIAGGHKILLFSQFTTMLDHLAQRLQEEKIDYYMLTGSVSKEKRAEMVEAFNTDQTPVFCISLKAGGTGLNLTAADIVIHFDPWWNLAVQNQATDRAHRIGQKHVVNVYKLIVKGTIEENILKLQEKKRELADQILAGEGLNGSSLTKEELMELLQLS